MNHYFNIAYIDGTVTIPQVYQLYKMGALTIEQCARIFNIKPDSIPHKWHRVKNGIEKKLILREWEKERLIQELESNNQKISKILNQESEKQ